ncbi:unnamed protein product, partial [Phaeothamnion confervicola]
AVAASVRLACFECIGAALERFGSEMEALDRGILVFEPAEAAEDSAQVQTTGGNVAMATAAAAAAKGLTAIMEAASPLFREGGVLLEFWRQRRNITEAATASSSVAAHPEAAARAEPDVAAAAADLAIAEVEAVPGSVRAAAAGT